MRISEQRIEKEPESGNMKFSLVFILFYNNGTEGDFFSTYYIPNCIAYRYMGVRLLSYTVK